MLLVQASSLSLPNDRRDGHKPLMWLSKSPNGRPTLSSFLPSWWRSTGLCTFSPACWTVCYSYYSYSKYPPQCIHTMPVLLCLYDVQLNNSCKRPPKNQIIAFQCWTVLVSRMQNKWGFKPIQWRYIHTHACSGYYKCSDSRISISLSHISLSQYSMENKNWPLLSSFYWYYSFLYISNQYLNKDSELQVCVSY